MLSSEHLDRDTARLNAAKKACVQAERDWPRRFWGDVYFRLQNNMKIRSLYAQINGSERSPINPIHATWDH